MEHAIIIAGAEVGIGIGQLIMIGLGLRQLNKASEERTRQLDKASAERTRQLDIMESGQREQSRTQAEALGKIGLRLIMMYYVNFPA